eukprot:582100-Hanusia_phi.AAC.1
MAESYGAAAPMASMVLADNLQAETQNPRQGRSVSHRYHCCRGGHGCMWSSPCDGTQRQH